MPGRWIGLLLLLSFFSGSPAAVAQTHITFRIVPATTLVIGQPVTLQARWPGNPLPNYVIHFEYRANANSDWRRVHATSDTGELLRTNGQILDYVCDSSNCQLVVRPTLTAPTTLEFRMVASNRVTGKRHDSPQGIAVTWQQPVVQAAPPPPATPLPLTLRLTTNGTACDLTFQPGGPATHYCRSPIDGPPLPGSARVPIAADGSVQAISAQAVWQGFQNLPWGWEVEILYAGRTAARCLGADGHCQFTIPARPARSFDGNSIGRDSVVAFIRWDGRSGANPSTAPPNGFHFNGLSIEQTIDYMR